MPSTQESLGRQVHVSATVEHGSRELAEALFAERDPLHRWQAIISRQGEAIDSLTPDRLHERRLFTRSVDGDWSVSLIAP